MSDPIADMLTRVRNALMVGKPTCEIPSSKIKVEGARYPENLQKLVNR